MSLPVSAIAMDRNETDRNNAARRAGEVRSHRLVVIAIISSLATLLIATFYPSSKPADDLMSPAVIHYPGVRPRTIQ